MTIALNAEYDETMRHYQTEIVQDFRGLLQTELESLLLREVPGQLDRFEEAWRGQVNNRIWCDIVREDGLPPAIRFARWRASELRDSTAESDNLRQLFGHEDHVSRLNDSLSRIQRNLARDLRQLEPG